MTYSYVNGYLFSAASIAVITSCAFSIGDFKQTRVDFVGHPVADPGIQSTGADCIIMPGVEHEQCGVIHHIIFFHHNKLDFAIHNVFAVFASAFIGSNNQFAGFPASSSAATIPGPLQVKPTIPVKSGLGCITASTFWAAISADGFVILFGYNLKSVPATVSLKPLASGLHVFRLDGGEDGYFTGGQTTGFVFSNLEFRHDYTQFVPVGSNVRQAF